MKLIQKKLFKGSREFEVIDDSVYVRIKSLFKEEKIIVGLSMLNPEPLVNGNELEFHSRYKSRPLLSLLINNPNAEEFNSFVDALKLQVMQESGTTEVFNNEAIPDGMERNVYDEAPEFDEIEQNRVRNKGQAVNVSEVESAIQMLETYVEDDKVKPLIAALQILKTEPLIDAHMQKVVDVFNGLGIVQGAVLTYAPYLSVFLSDDPFGKD